MSKLKIFKATVDDYCFSLYHCLKAYVCLTKVSFNALGLRDSHFHEQLYKINGTKNGFNLMKITH